MELIPPLSQKASTSPWRWFSLRYLLVIVPVLVSIRLWSFQAAPEHAIWAQVERVLLLSLGLATILRWKSIQFLKNGFTFHRHIILLFVLSFAPFLPLYLFDNQSPIRSLNTNMHMIYWLIYFIIYSVRIPKEDILKIMIFIGITCASLNMVQQFTFPKVYFFSRANFENDIPFENRAGIFRFMVQGTHYSMLASYFALNRFLTTKRISYLGIMLFLLGGVYCTATRQIMAVNLFGLTALYLAFLWQRGRHTELKIAFFVVVPITALMLFGEAIFGKLLEQTAEESTKDNIRLQSLRFFLFDYWPHWLNFYLGNGVPYYYSEKAIFLRHMEQDFGYFASDVGIVGILHYRGAIYTLVCIATTFKGVLVKIDTEHLFLPIAFLGYLSILPINPVFISFDFYPLFLMIAYVLEQRIRENRLAASSRAT